MDHSDFMSRWNFSSLDQQKILSENDFQQPLFPCTQNLNHFNSPLLEEPQFSEKPRRFPQTISWSSEEIIIPKGEICSNEERINWGCQLTNHGKVLPKKTPQEHIIAERKRREKLSQKFIALAAIIPGLKKVDKASILRDTINYVKQLEQTLKSLESQNARNTVESVVLFNNSKQCIRNTNDISQANNFIGNISKPSNSIENSNSGSSAENSRYPEIQVRLSARTVLVKIHCENTKGVLVKVLSEMEKLNLVVMNANAMPFIESFLDITVTAQMEEGSALTTKDLVKTISSIFLHSSDVSHD